MISRKELAQRESAAHARCRQDPEKVEYLTQELLEHASMYAMLIKNYIDAYNETSCEDPVKQVRLVVQEDRVHKEYTFIPHEDDRFMFGEAVPRFPVDYMLYGLEIFREAFKALSMKYEWLSMRAGLRMHGTRPEESVRQQLARSSLENSQKLSHRTQANFETVFGLPVQGWEPTERQDDSDNDVGMDNKKEQNL
jgi:hypothetical protein